MMDKDKLIRRIERLQEKLERIKAGRTTKQMSDHYTYHGGWNVGYLEGKISVYEDILDLMEEQENGQDGKGES